MHVKVPGKLIDHVVRMIYEYDIVESIVYSFRG